MPTAPAPCACLMLLAAALLAPVPSSGSALDQMGSSSTTTTTTSTTGAPTTTPGGSGSGGGGTDDDDTDDVPATTTTSAAVATQAPTAGPTETVAPSTTTAAPASTTTTATSPGTAANVTAAALPTMGLVLDNIDYEKMSFSEVLALETEIITQIVNHSSGLIHATDVVRIDLALVHAGNSSRGQQQQQQQQQRRRRSASTNVSTQATVVFKEDTAQFVAAAAVLVNDAIASASMVLTFTVQGQATTFVVQRSTTVSNTLIPTQPPAATTQPPLGDAADGSRLDAGAWAAITVVLVAMAAVAAAAAVYHARQAQRAQSGTQAPVRRGSAELRKETATAEAKGADTAGLVDGARNTPSFYEEQAFTVKQESGELGVKSVRRENPSYGLQYTQ